MYNNLLIKTEQLNRGINIDIFTTEGDFIAQANLLKVKDDSYAMYSSLARPTYGKILFDSIAMYMKTIDSYFCGDPNGDYTSQTIKVFQEFNEKTPPSYKKDVSDVINIDWDQDKQHEFMYQAYSKEPTIGFYEMLENSRVVDIEKKFREMKSKVNDLLGSEEAYDELFEMAYEKKDNKWIDTLLPLDKSKTLRYKFK